MAYPTTDGEGPYRPMIVDGFHKYKMNRTFPTEREAHAVARVAFLSAMSEFNRKLNEMRFLRTGRHTEDGGEIPTQGE